MKKVKSLRELYVLSSDPKYKELTLISSLNLGGPDNDFQKAYNWLEMNAMEVNERSVVKEINGCIPFVSNRK